MKRVRMENKKIRVELTALDLAKLVEFLNMRSHTKAIEEVEEGNEKASLAIYESYNTKIGGIVISLIECLTTGVNPQTVYGVEDEEYVLLANQA